MLADTVTFDVDGTEVGAVHWHGRPGAPTVIAIHGITANAWSWAAVARHLDGEIPLVAVDLRGRGMSHGAPGPYGMRRHADDIAEIIEQLGVRPAVLAGHSMGTYVALACAERHPASVSELVLVDGGIALPLPEGMTAQEALDAIVGPAVARLQVVWPDRAAYRTMWAEHPAFAETGLTPELEQYLLSDLVDGDSGFRSCVSEAAIRFDGGELLSDAEMRGLLDRRDQPVTIVRAEAGIMGAPPPLIPDEWIDRYPRHDWRTIQGTNHYTIVVGERGADAVAQALRDVVARVV